MLTRPMLEMGLNDDWSYIWSARVLSNTGHIVYNGWSTAMLGWQLYLGALFFKLFGFSFLIARVSILMVAMATVMLIQRLFVRFGINEWNATIGTLAIALSPLFLPLAFLFMSDVPGVFCLVLCIYSCTRAIQERTDRAAIGWLVFAALSNDVGGTVRQIAWLGALVIVPSAAWQMRNRARIPIVGTALWMISVIFVGACMHWFGHQPYSIPEPVFHLPYGGEKALWRSMVIRNSLAIFFFVLPILIAFIAKFPFAERRPRKEAVIAATVFFVAVALHISLHKREGLLVPFASQSGNIVNTGDLSYTLQVALSVLTFAGIGGLLLFYRNASYLTDRALAYKAAPSTRSFLFLLGPFTVIYLFLLLTRVHLYDRYLLPLLIVAVAVLLRLYEKKIGGRLPSVCLFLLLLFGAFAIARMHDVFAVYRAQLAAANEILRSGVPRTEIQGGFEYDAWTQLEVAGYVNDDRLRIPAGAYHPWKRPENVLDNCYSWFAEHTPAVNPRYVLVFDKACFTPSQFSPVIYHAWFAPHQRMVFIQKVH
jgi:hypothetical protein